ncbi:MAG: hypothetical protein U0935_19010 [Pirellulales bacterium]
MAATSAPPWADQFSEGRPSYNAGLVFEVPWGNRAARVRDERRALGCGSCSISMPLRSGRFRLEVEVRGEVTTSQQELLAKHEAVQARDDQLRNLTLRWRQLRLPRLPPA